MAGPTTVGSIDARITADASDFRRETAEVRREAAEVGALSPTVDVHADVGGALAALSAVSKAERDLDVAYQRTAISQSRLSSATHRFGDDSVQAATARLALTRATNAEHDAEVRLAAVRTHSTAVTETDTAAVGRNVSENNRRISGLQVLLALAPAIVAAAAPVGAAAVGLGGAFGVMATAGVFAFKGIQREMELGTTLGAKYSAGLDTMSGYMDALKHSTAVGMLASFNQAQRELGLFMPTINSMLGQFSGTLGQVGNTALRGVLTGLVQLNPLIQEGGVQLGNFVSWLTSFSENNGFSGFVQYATANLPSVIGLIQSLVSLAGNILAAFAPLGPVVVGLITGLSDALNGLPLPILAGLVTSALLLGPALRLAFSATVSGLIGKAAIAIGLTGTMAQLAVPVVGVLTAAIAGIAVASTAAALSTGQNTVAVQDYTQALIDDKNAIGEHVKAQSAKALVDSGAAQAAMRLGMSLEGIQAAALGNADAMAAVRNATDKAAAGIVEMGSGGAYASEKNVQLTKDVDLMRNSVLASGPALEDQILKQKLLGEMLGTASDATNYQVAAAQELAAQHGISSAAYQAATSAQESAASQLETTTAKMYLQNDAAGILKAALDGLNGEAITAAQAQNSFDSALVNMGDHVDKTGKQITFTTTSITDMSSASVALRGQLNSQVTNLQNVVAANGGLTDSTGKAKAEMVKMRQQIIDNAVAHGVDREAVTQYINKILQIPKTVPPTKLDVDSAVALSQLARFQSAVNALQGKEVWITSHINSIYSETHVSTGQGGSGGQTKSEGGAVYRANGGPVYLANGGHSSGPRGTDTVAAWLTPGEHVMRRSSAQSIGAPALNYMNQTGKLPPSGGGGMVTVNLVLDGQVIDRKIINLSSKTAEKALDDFAIDLQNRRS